ncbi:MAG: SUMF1/EgtB/PvdO family nonheme iron enzyme, partial [Brevundimonas sp.]|nr:SUMF1/EgtB/PvdO family nonheme iron enzyme [Brevundimonas sp.]
MSDPIDGAGEGREALRLDAVRRYDILDTPPDGSFDRLAAIAARRFKTPIAIISIVDNDRIWFKSHHGLNVSEIDRAPGLCASAILSAETYVLTDAKLDPRSLANPLVAGEFGLRFYAAAPLITHDGFNLGTLCVIDFEPREPDEEPAHTVRVDGPFAVGKFEVTRAQYAAFAKEAGRGGKSG